MKASSKPARKSTKVANKPKKAAAGNLLKDLLDEKEAIVGPDFWVQVEEEIASPDMASTRQMALIFLGTPFKETAEKIRDDRKKAETFVDLVKSINGSAERYRNLAELLTMAETRIEIALSQRKDLREIVELAKSRASASGIAMKKR
jgi:hypothetical protein